MKIVSDNVYNVPNTIPGSQQTFNKVKYYPKSRPYNRDTIDHVHHCIPKT